MVHQVFFYRRFLCVCVSPWLGPTSNPGKMSSLDRPVTTVRVLVETEKSSHTKDQVLLSLPSPRCMLFRLGPVSTLSSALLFRLTPLSAYSQPGSKTCPKTVFSDHRGEIV